MRSFVNVLVDVRDFDFILLLWFSERLAIALVWKDVRIDISEIVDLPNVVVNEEDRTVRICRERNVERCEGAGEHPRENHKPREHPPDPVPLANSL
jgi:hypothetical protein